MVKEQQLAISRTAVADLLPSVLWKHLSYMSEYTETGF